MNRVVKEVNTAYLVETAEGVVPAGYKKTEVGVIPEDWSFGALGQIGKFKNGINKSADDFGFGFPFVNLMDVFGKPTIDETTSLDLINSTDLDRTEYSLFKGDVLFIRSSVKPSGVGLTTVIQDDLKNTVFSGFLIRFRCEGALIADFMRHCFAESSFRQRVIAGSTISANTNINQDNLKRIALAWPSSIEEQIVISTALSNVDMLISELEKLIAKKQAIKAASLQQLLTGRIRLPQFAFREDGSIKGLKNSELGEIPKDWEAVSLGSLATKITGGGTPSRGISCYWGGSIPWVTVKDFATFTAGATQESITEAGLKNSSSSLIPSGTVITSTRMALGKAVIYDVDVAINQDLKAIHTTHLLNARYLLYWFEFNQSKIADIGSGSTVKGLALSDLRSILFVLPPVREQKEIVSMLSNLDIELKSLKVRLAKTRQLKQGMMQQLLTGKIRLVKPSTVSAS